MERWKVTISIYANDLLSLALEMRINIQESEGLTDEDKWELYALESAIEQAIDLLTLLSN